MTFTPIADLRPNDTPWPELTWPVWSEIVLRGDHVLLQPLDPIEDAAGLLAALDHDAVWTHLSDRPLLPQSLQAALLAHQADSAWQQWLVRRTTGEVVGVTSYLDACVADARLEVGTTAYAPAVWGTVVNPDAKLLLLERAFGHLAPAACSSKPTSATSARNGPSSVSGLATKERYAATSNAPTAASATPCCSPSAPKNGRQSRPGCEHESPRSADSQVTDD